MKKTALYLALAFLCPLSQASASCRAEDSRKEGEITFNRLLGKLTADYEKGLKQGPSPASPVPA